MASDYFLEIEGIKGESKDDAHQQMIDVESFSWGASRGVDAKGTTLLAGEGLTVRHHYDKATPVLALSCAQGKHIPKAVLYVRKSSGDQGDYYKVTLSDVLISSFKHSAEDGALGLDEVSLDYAGVAIDYAVVKRGVLGETFQTGDIPHQNQ